MPALPSFRVMPNPYGHFQDARNAAEDRANARADRDYRDTQRRAAQAYGQHVAAGQYDDAATVAGKMGDAEAVSSARSMGRNEIFRNALELNSSLTEIAQMTDPDQQRAAYAAWWNEALQRGARGGVLNDDVRAAFEAEHPAPDSPDLAQRLPALAASSRERLTALAQSAVGPEEWLEMQQGPRGAQRRYTPASGGILDTFTGDVQRNPHYVRGGRAGADDEPPLPPGASWD